MHRQIHNREKYERVRCPYCNAISRVIDEHSYGFQERVCRNGHTFTYDYLLEAYSHLTLNYKQGF